MLRFYVTEVWKGSGMFQQQNDVTQCESTFSLKIGKKSGRSRARDKYYSFSSIRGCYSTRCIAFQRIKTCKYVRSVNGSCIHALQRLWSLFPSKTIRETEEKVTSPLPSQSSIFRNSHSKSYFLFNPRLACPPSCHVLYWSITVTL